MLNVLFASYLLFASGCSVIGTNNHIVNEDEEAKQMLQGIWINDEEGVPALMAKGDSLFFPDTTS